MTTSRCRKVGKSPFPLLSTASLRVCQTPMRFLVSNVHMEQVRWSDVTCNHLKRTACSWQSAGTRKLASLLSHFYAQLRCVCARRPCDSWFQCAHGASALKWCYLQPPDWREQRVHDNLQVQENWQVSLPTSIHSFVACVPDAHAILGSNVHMERVRWSDVTCNRLTEENNLFMTTCKCRKTGKSPFPLLCTASLRVCQMPLRFLDPICTWSELWSDTCNRLKRTACSWQPAGTRKLASLLLGSRTSNPESPSLQSRISNLESRISDLGFRISNLESRISNLESRISDLESRISNLESRISDLESRISNLGSRISDLESRISNLESIVTSAFSIIHWWFRKFFH